MLTHRNVVANLFQMIEWMKPILVEGDELALLALPLYHIFSLTVNAMGLFSSGATNLMVTNPRDIPDFMKTLRKYRITLFPCLNTLFNAYSSLRSSTRSISATEGQRRRRHGVANGGRRSVEKKDEIYDR